MPTQTLNHWRPYLLERTLSALDRLAARRKQVQQIPAHLATGERGEEAAFFFLRRLGYTIVAQRWNDGPLPGDLDLVAWDHGTLCFIEVKTRTSRDIAPASAAVDRHKRQTLRRLAKQYLRHLDTQAEVETRFDIVAVYDLPGQPRQMQLIPAAFDWRERPAALR